MAAILYSAMLDSDTLLSSLRFTQKHSLSTLTLIQTNSIWLKPIHSHTTWWWQPPWTLPGWIQILPSWIQTPCYLLSDSLKNTLTPFWLLTQTNSIWLKLIHSHLTLWWQPSWTLPGWIQILPSRIQTPCYLLSDSLKNTLTPFWLWLKLIQSDSNSFFLT